jgi:hypothetical protein
MFKWDESAFGHWAKDCGKYHASTRAEILGKPKFRLGISTTVTSATYPSTKREVNGYEKSVLYP